MTDQVAASQVKEQEPAVKPTSIPQSEPAKPESAGPDDQTNDALKALEALVGSQESVEQKPETPQQESPKFVDEKRFEKAFYEVTRTNSELKHQVEELMQFAQSMVANQRRPVPQQPQGQPDVEALLTAVPEEAKPFFRQVTGQLSTLHRQLIDAKERSQIAEAAARDAIDLNRIMSNPRTNALFQKYGEKAMQIAAETGAPIPRALKEAAGDIVFSGGGDDRESIKEELKRDPAFRKEMQKDMLTELRKTMEQVRSGNVSMSGGSHTPASAQPSAPTKGPASIEEAFAQAKTRKT